MAGSASEEEGKSNSQFPSKGEEEGFDEEDLPL